ncbi:hypothetical protein [Streptomyces melanogenes]|uniref:hypothetical protein n=1 Tax=Streptomyces melanogenes TaxID=67326 RepID=UPI00378D7E92
MSRLAQALTLLTALAVLIALAALYLRHVRMPRPPVGRFVRSDIAVMTVTLVSMPLIYLHLPRALTACAFGAVFLGACSMALAPVVGGRRGAAVALALGAFILSAHLARWVPVRIAAGDLLLALAVIGVSNLWAQTGMTAGQVAALAGLLAPYDLLATGLTSVTAHLVHHFAGMPLGPMLAVDDGTSPIGAGLGDCLMLTLWPLVAAKAFGRAAGWCGAIIGLCVVSVVLAGAVAGWVHGGVPLLTGLGPCIVAQYAYWRTRRGPERRTVGWRGTAVEPSADPFHGQDVAAALTIADQHRDAGWLAVAEGRAVGHAPSPGGARRAAREAGHTAVPVVVAVRPRDTAAQANAFPVVDPPRTDAGQAALLRAVGGGADAERMARVRQRRTGSGEIAPISAAEWP